MTSDSSSAAVGGLYRAFRHLSLIKVKKFEIFPNGSASCSNSQPDDRFVPGARGDPYAAPRSGRPPIPLGGYRPEAEPEFRKPGWTEQPDAASVELDGSPLLQVSQAGSNRGRGDSFDIGQCRRELSGL